jgi:hypothetical protein
MALLDSTQLLFNFPVLLRGCPGGPSHIQFASVTTGGGKKSRKADARTNSLSFMSKGLIGMGGSV